MQPGANVKSVEALESFRAALGLFSDEADQALTMAMSEAQRFLDWLEHDRLSHWKREVRVREERLAEAKTDLHRCLSATIDPNRTPSCYQEKKVVEAAKRKLGEAENKLSAVHRWIPIIRTAVQDFRLRIQPLQDAVASDVPRARSAIEGAVARLMAYLNLESNAPYEPASATEEGTASMVRPVEEAAGATAETSAETSAAARQDGFGPDDSGAPGRPAPADQEAL